MRVRIIWAFACAAVVAAGPARAESCSPHRIADSATALQDARFALSQVPAQEAGTTALPGETGTAIADVKTRLVDFIGAYMNCQHPNSDPGGIQVDLSRLGWARDPDAPPPVATDPLKPDTTLNFDVRPFAGGLLGITAAFGIPCGSDSVLMLFEEREEGWHEILRVQGAPYRDLTHSDQALDYDISPLDDEGHWFLAEKHLSTVCGLSGATMNYSVFRQGIVASKPRLVFSGHDPMYGGDFDTGRLDVTANGFAVHFHGMTDEGVADIERAFTVAGNIVQPVHRAGAQ